MISHYEVIFSNLAKPSLPWAEGNRKGKIYYHFSSMQATRIQEMKTHDINLKSNRKTYYIYLLALGDLLAN